MLEVPVVLPTCEEISERLSEWIDGELEPWAVRRVELHLATCAACTRLAAELVATVDALHRCAARRRRAPDALH